MGEKKFSGAPFGTQKKRFDVAGVHPNSKLPGSFTQVPYCTKSMEQLNRIRGPGRYLTEVGGFHSSSVEERASGPGWSRAYEVMRMAKMPHLLHKEQWEEKRLLVRKLGPGTYDIKDFLEVGDEKPRSSRGFCGTRDRRFKQKSKEHITPGPGTYGKGGIPQLDKEERANISKGNITVMEGAVGDRALPTVGSQLGPGTYNFKSSSQQMKEKMTSTRGPYDLFTGERNKPMITGHLAKPNNASLGPGQYEFKSCLDEHTSKHRTKHGKFTKMADQHPQKAERIFCHTLSQCPTNMDYPGPGAYEQVSLSKPTAKNSPGFLSSARRDDKRSQQFFTQNFNAVGAGRYDVQKWEEAQHVNGHSSVFVSKSQGMAIPRRKFLQERIRAKDIQLKDRIFMVKPEHPEQYIAKTDMHNAYIAHRAATIA